MCRAPSPTTLPKKPPRSLIPLALRISRPYYYLVTLWLYLLPTGGRYELFSTYPFWLGLAYCTLPLNLLTYLMNDYADVAVDADNPRKGGALLGAKEDAARLRAVVPIAAVVQLPFLLAFAALCGAVTWPWFLAVVFVNWLYNFGPRLSSGHYPPLDLFCPCGYLLVILLSCWLNNLPYPPQKSFMHAAILVVRTQLWIQTPDDRRPPWRPRRAGCAPLPTPQRGGVRAGAFRQLAAPILLGRVGRDARRAGAPHEQEWRRQGRAGAL